MPLWEWEERPYSLFISNIHHSFIFINWFIIVRVSLNCMKWNTGCTTGCKFDPSLMQGTMHTFRISELVRLFSISNLPTCMFLDTGRILEETHMNAGRTFETWQTDSNPCFASNPGPWSCECKSSHNVWTFIKVAFFFNRQKTCCFIDYNYCVNYYYSIIIVSF